MTGNVAVGFISAGQPSPITIPTNWGTQGGGASPQTSTAKTLTVPAGNPGNVLLHYTLAPLGTGQYIKNGGAGVPFSVDTVVAFANGDTLAFKLIGAADNMNTTVSDNTVSVQIGTCNLTTA